MIQSNRDLYLFIIELAQRPTASCALATFLCALAHVARPGAAHRTVPVARFAEWLEAALDLADGVATQPAPPPQGAHPDFAGWHARIAAQVDDLSAMAAAGTLADPMVYFGANAPSGERWFNVTTSDYLECATCGMFGGWEPGDPGGRDFVPGLCVAMAPDSTVAMVDPQSIPRPLEEVGPLSWSQLTRFLEMGQYYE